MEVRFLYKSYFNFFSLSFVSMLIIADRYNDGVLHTMFQSEYKIPRKGISHAPNQGFTAAVTFH